ncbi:MAG: ORF6N domain-containing protein [Lachnospiraceae bacterium]|nr:ORF6N domain-containing protein [Lachnospiraceae bacterium]
MNEIKINDTVLPIKEYNGQRVVTFKDVDTVHSRPDGTARKRFNGNKKHFIEGVDFFSVQMSEKRTLGFDVPNRGLTLLTESGYLMLVKSFTDDIAWDVQRQLVNSYFRVKAEQAAQRRKPAIEMYGYEYIPITFNDEPVITLRDFAHFANISSPDVVRGGLEKTCERHEDYYILQYDDLAAFKAENPSFGRRAAALVVLSERAVIKLESYYCVKGKVRHLFEGREETPPPVIVAPERPAPTAEACLAAIDVLKSALDSIARAITK